MSKTMLTMMIVMMVGLPTVARQTLAGDPLLEIEVNGEGDILEVRDNQGTLTTASIQSIPIDEDGLRFITAQSLFVAEVVSKVDGTVQRCCNLSGRNIRCLEEMRYFIDDAGEVTRVEGKVEEEWIDLMSEDTMEDAHSHAPAEIRSLKSLAIAVFQDKDGDRYGMVIPSEVISPEESSGTELSMWFNAGKFKPADK